MVGLVVALRDGIYLVQLEIGARLRVRRLTDGRVRCMAKQSLKLMVAQRAAYVIARRPGRFAEMPCEELIALHGRLQFEEISECSFNQPQEQ
jgi:hypothetical protein